MSEKIVNGKRSLATKPKNTSIVTDDAFGNPLMLSPELQKELKDQGLEGRFVNAKKLYEFQGYHPKGWVPYKRKSSDTMNSSDFIIGTDPSGIIRRGDCILAVKSSAQAEKHRQLLKEKADRQSGHQSEAARELRSMSRGIAKIEEGYGSEEGDSED